MDTEYFEALKFLMVEDYDFKCSDGIFNLYLGLSERVLFCVPGFHYSQWPLPRFSLCGAHVAPTCWAFVALA